MSEIEFEQSLSTKLAEQQEIERQTREYLANGGKIQELPSSGQVPHKGCKTWSWGWRIED